MGTSNLQVGRALVCHNTEGDLLGDVSNANFKCISRGLLMNNHTVPSLSCSSFPLPPLVPAIVVAIVLLEEEGVPINCPIK